MVLKAEGKIAFNPRGKTGILYIPSSLTIDSAFPLNIPSRVSIKIEGERLIVEKVKS